MAPTGIDRNSAPSTFPDAELSIPFVQAWESSVLSLPELFLSEGP